MEASSLIFITGGVRSGKSSFAESKAIEIASNKERQLIYLATGVSSDSEMKERIEIHQRDRNMGPYKWKTIERPVQIGGIVDVFNNQDIILLDCVTTLLNNELFSTDRTWDDSFFKTVKENIITGIISIKDRAGTMIVVSNEVLFESLLATDIVFFIWSLAGTNPSRISKNGGSSFLVEAGIPIVMKGASQ